MNPSCPHPLMALRPTPAGGRAGDEAASGGPAPAHPATRAAGPLPKAGRLQSPAARGRPAPGRPLSFGAALLLAACTTALPATAETLNYGRFGDIAVLRPEGVPRSVTILVSGHAGAGGAEAEIGRLLNAEGALVLSVDGGRLGAGIRPKPDETCADVGWDFEAMSQYVQKELGLGDYRRPLLVGVGEGAALVFLGLAEATPNTFLGGMALGFDPNWRSPWPLCGGDQGEVGKPAADGRGWQLATSPEYLLRWTVLQGAADPYVAGGDVARFVEGVPNAELVSVPGVGHGFADPPRWRTAFLDAWKRLNNDPYQDRELTDLPLVELPVPQPDGEWLAVILSGDGGWAAIDRELGETFQQAGIPVVGFDMLRYLWKARTPEETAQAVERTIQRYLQVWQRKRVLLVGYSLGGDVLPFVVNRLSPQARAKLALAGMLAPSKYVEFEFHPWDWISDDDDAKNPRARPLDPELAAVRTRLLCVYGADEKADSACPPLRGRNPLVESVELPGGHHFDGNYAALARRLLEAAQAPAAGR